jgi:glycosyltransferase involved in cell wall biosynthesis
LSEITPRIPHPETKRTRFFIGIQRKRDAYKGTDIMYKALVKLATRYPDRIEIVKAESVPFAQYNRMMDHSDVLLDQLYSYTPAMNALCAMAKGLVVVGGGEEENYEILGEKELRPIVNVLPSFDDVYAKLEELIQHPEDIARLSAESIQYVRRHHDHRKVAERYVAFWKSRT